MAGPTPSPTLRKTSPAILDGWYLGQEGGTAAAEVLFGDYNPAGRLPITVPRTVGQIPDYYYQKPSAKREYLDDTTKPLFPFGWGLELLDVQIRQPPSGARFDRSRRHHAASA